MNLPVCNCKLPGTITRCQSPAVEFYSLSIVRAIEPATHFYARCAGHHENFANYGGWKVTRLTLEEYLVGEVHES